MKYAKIRELDVSNGPGVRVSLFTQGCFHKCKNCFNPETWDFTCGKEWDDKTNRYIKFMMSRAFVKGLSILGGDPLCLYDFNIYNKYMKDEDDKLFNLLKEMKDLYPNKSIWLWTGYEIDNIIDFNIYNSQLNADGFDFSNLNELSNDIVKYILNNNDKHSNSEIYKEEFFMYASQLLLNYVDVVIDGPFIESKKDISLKYAGSTNQRIIDMRKSFDENDIILYE